MWGEFVANIVKGIDSSVFPRLEGQYRPFAVYPLLNGVCFACYASAIRVIHHFHDNRVQWKFQYPESVCERLLSVMSIRRVFSLVTASVLSVGCTTSATVCRAVGRQEANTRAKIRKKRTFACFIVYYAISETRLCVVASEDGLVIFAVVDESAAETEALIGETIECGV